MSEGRGPSPHPGRKWAQRPPLPEGEGDRPHPHLLPTRVWPRREPWWEVALDLLLPPRCVHCGRRGAEICAECLASLRLLGPGVCPRCSRPSRGGRICERCAGRQSPLRAIVAAYPFEGPIRSAILAFKYSARTRLAPFLASTLAARLATRPLTVDYVIPVPLSRGRLQSRGFNQSELLARPLAAANGWFLDGTSLVRARDTRQQTELPARERRANVVGAFACVRPEAIQGQRVLLVDDVCTTGATLEACAMPLLEAGAAGVWGLVVARDLMRSR